MTTAATSLAHADELTETSTCAGITRRENAPGFRVVRPAWAHSCGWKSRHELVTASEVKRNCVRVTERGEEAWSVNRVPMNKNRI
ncbi:hypothetical protein [Sinorhizobium meliloti]|nr:hypothetical protein [Sinorhizobium meliloti]